MKSLRDQEYIVSLESTLADLRMRNGELSTTLQDSSPTEWENITPESIRAGAFRTNRIESVIKHAVLWNSGYIHDDELKDSIEYLLGYLGEWAQMQVDMHKRAEKAAASRAKKKDDET